MMRHVARLSRSLDHQDNILCRINVAQRRQAPRQLVAKDEPQVPGHAPALGWPGLAVPRQWSEQWVTFSQSRAHFLRQVKGRPQITQILVGRSDFLRILGIGRSCSSGEFSLGGYGAFFVCRHLAMRHGKGGAQITRQLILGAALAGRIGQAQDEGGVP